MEQEIFKYLVVENAVDVCEGIERRMQSFSNWASLGYTTTPKKAIETISCEKPQLIYVDWALNGGSAFEILQFIQNDAEYNPYIIFNTGFQSDNPEIPQEVMNRYKIDKYLVKPFWEDLRNNLSIYLKEAEEKYNNSLPKAREVWVQDENGAKILIQLDNLHCISQNTLHPRRRNFHTSTKTVVLPLTWEKCYEMLQRYGIDYFVTKTREHLVTRKFVESFDKPFVRFRNSTFKVEVVKEKITEFSKWLLSSDTSKQKN